MRKISWLQPWMIVGVSFGFLEASNFLYNQLHWQHFAEGMAILSLLLAAYGGVLSLLKRRVFKRASEPVVKGESS